MGDGDPFKGTNGLRINFILHFGTTILGESARCDTCHSYIATKWLLFVMPVIPIASYRLSQTTSVDTGTTVYEGRRISLYTPHIFMVLALYGLLALLVLYAAYA